MMICITGEVRRTISIRLLKFLFRISVCCSTNVKDDSFNALASAQDIEYLSRNILNTSTGKHGSHTDVMNDRIADDCDVASHHVEGAKQFSVGISNTRGGGRGEYLPRVLARLIVVLNIQFTVDNDSLDFGKKSKTMGVGKKVKKFCNWAFSRKSGKTQQNQRTTEGDLEHQRCSDGEAGPSNAAFISHIYTGAGVSPSPAPQKAEKKLKRFRKWFSRKFKKTKTRAQQTQPSSPQTQRPPDGGAASVSPRPVQDERVNNRCVSIQTPVKTPSTETEQHDDTECWHYCLSSLTTEENSESDRASLQSWHFCASSLGTAISESDRASVFSWHSCASSLGTAEISESDRASVHSRHPCASSLTPDHNDEENASSEDSSVSEENTSSSSDDIFWKTEENTPFNVEGADTGNIYKEYKVDKLIGRGTFGTVSAGIRLSDSRTVAIKYVNKTHARRTMKILPYQKTVPQEVGLMYLISRGPYVPQIIQLLDWYESRNQYVLVVERPEPCMDLDRFVMQNGWKISESKARVIIHQVVTAANACCERGVYHSDIKLENLLINPHTLQIKLIDFGAGSVVTKIGYTTFRGTRAYAPPEFDKCGRLHAKTATVYSIGVLLFKMLCGHFPKKELSKIATRTWQPDDLSKECIDLICSCLQSDPAKRIRLEKILLHDFFQVLILKPSNRRND
ncbi:mitogen-activated protein kinase kinase kinase 15-like [Danio aesculapii]|uniref:mitogen-activated protein kinase kinase kinase 15-like n=1 Tax=Danio aesculapii TaxID=1142201 RepID=UPI0024BFC180|nr:mitogen-activated protein kinase kinase kinase 15-like [Danio aesculapii]